MAPRVSATGPQTDAVVLDQAKGFPGLAIEDTSFVDPPDPQVAVGPDHVLEAVNSAIRIFDKAGNILATQQFEDFFAALSPSPLIGQPAASYDELSGRFVVAAINRDLGTEESKLLFAVSNSADPTAGFTEMHAIDTKEAGLQFPGHDTFSDSLKLGWNANAFVLAVDQFTFDDVVPDAFDHDLDHVSVYAIDKSTVVDANAGTLTSYLSTRSVVSHASMAPAEMHGAIVTDPMYFVEEAGIGNGTKIRVVKMTNVLSAAPTYTDTDLVVSGYAVPQDAHQPFDEFMNLVDARIVNAQWRANRLVAAHTIRLASDNSDHARWYEFNTAAAPTLTQQGTVDPDPIGVTDTYYPSVAINAAGDIGITYMQSSATQYVSMYVAGQNTGDTAGSLRPAALAASGTDLYFGNFAGETSGIAVDPTDDSFWAAHEYSSGSDFWNTWIQNFSVDTTAPAPDVIYAAEDVPFEKLDLKLKKAGVVAALDNRDDEFVPIDLGTRTFKFYGHTYTGDNQLFASSNGLITFGSGNNDWGNTDLTGTPNPGERTIAAAWDDWTTNASTKGTKSDLVLYKFDDANNRLIVEWNALRKSGESLKENVTFQAILALNTTDNGAITIQFVDMVLKGSSANLGGRATVGVKNHGPQGTERLLLSFNQAGSTFIGDGKKEAVRISDTAAASSTARTARSVGTAAGYGALLQNDLLDVLVKSRASIRRKA